jgi:hypothetical protein
MEINHVAFATNLKPFNTFSFNAHMPSYAKFLWRSVHMALGIKPPRNAQNLFNDWLFWKDETFRSLLLMTGVAGILWSIWITRSKLFLMSADSNLFCRFYSW